MAEISLYYDKRNIRKDGTYPVIIIVKHQAKIHFASGITCTPEQWGGSELNKKVDNFKTKNSRLRDRMNKIESFLLLLERSGELKDMTDKKLKEAINEELKGKPKEKNIFKDTWDQFVASRTATRTKEIYKSTFNKIESFSKVQRFSDIDKNWLEKFDNHMSDEGLKVNARSIHMRNIRAVFNYAIDNDIIQFYPFRKFKIKRQKTPKRSLSDNQLKMIINYEGQFKEYADFFMLSFYLIGINIIDLLQAKEIINNRIEYYRAKTGRFYSILVQPEALTLINKYKGKERLLLWGERYKTYTSFTYRCDKNLKKLTYEAENKSGEKEIKPICAELSTYYARHTWATIAARLNIPKETIAAALGHGGDTVTDIYIDFDMKKVDKANRKVINCVLRLTK